MNEQVRVVESTKGVIQHGLDFSVNVIQVNFTATLPRLHGLQSYSQLNDSTTIRVKRADDAEKPSEFPAVIICNKNQLMKSATNEMMEEVITTLFDGQGNTHHGRITHIFRSYLLINFIKQFL